MSVDTDRVDWERAYRTLERADPRRQRNLYAAVEAVTQALRRRVGQTFTLAELAAAYGSVDRWGREAVEERAPHEGWARDLTLIEDAAFHLYSRGAIDYGP
ncbi:MAG: hypothetical protein ACYDA3_14075 [Gaiellaceae bacterium]